MTPKEKFDYLMSIDHDEGESLQPQIEITLSKDRLDTEDISYQRPSVPIRDVGFQKSLKQRIPEAHHSRPEI